MAVVDAPADQADCLAKFPTCNVTVGDLADCFVKVGTAQAACTNVQGALLGTPACVKAYQSSCL